MLSFGELRNNLKRLEDYSKSMNILARIGWSRNALDEKQIKSQPLQFYLRIIHYVLIEYSTQLYKVILDMIPNIKALTDQKFTESSFIISRKIFNMSPKITAEQFLQPSKLVEKKIEFIVDLCENIVKWETSSRKKASKEPKNNNQLRNYIAETSNSNKYNLVCDDEEEDDEQLMQREITVKPTECFEPLNHSFGKAAFGNDRLKEGANRQAISINTKPNVFPKNLKNEFLDDEDEEFTQTTKIPQKKPTEQPQSNKNNLKQVTTSQANEESTEYVTKQQFNEVLEMIASINGTVTGLVSKFNNFQMNVTSWFNNTNARIVLLQQNVKMIKSNL